ncbi:MAG: hypothetical protein KBE65_10095 [Phycisphaerae bacterium]|nr:hypothetical protein [Phycisphaerae bacterium]
MPLWTLSSKRIAVILLVGLLLCASALGVLRHQIQSGLDRWCTTAQAAHPHPSDDVAALLAYVQSEAHSLRERNYAVWALGQARDPRALPVLENHLTGKPCDHARDLCQGELGKAIALCKDPTPNLLGIRTPQKDGGRSRPTAAPDACVPLPTPQTLASPEFQENGFPRPRE